ATRKASQIALETLTAALPELLGGSADLTGSNLTQTAATAPLRFDEQGCVIKTAEGQIGRHINYGVREFGMAAIMNGVALHGGYIPYGGTFLTFSDYSRNAIRMAALMRQRVVHVFTHDSIGLGEDGPTHQSIEQTASLRLIPGLDVWRPADTEETAAAWSEALAQRERPTALLLSRQNLPYLPKTDCAHIARGGYVLRDAPAGKPRAILIATGSEVHLALTAQEMLAAKSIAIRVVSIPSTSVFDRQDAAWWKQVLPPGVPRVAVEAGVTAGWWKYGCAAVIGTDRYGESAPADDLFRLFGFTAENVAETVQAVLQNH
ncbi:MAG: transketolase, partial [Burkholderiaceae bacterium]|nr:transketolase [Burkholderiaceae bacterium]